MNREHGQGSLPIWLPMAMAQNLHSWSYFHQSLFWDRQKNSARQKKGRQSLPMSTPEPAARPEAFYFGLRTLHKFILIGRSHDDGGTRSPKCPSSNMSAKSAPMSSRPWFTAAKRRSVPSATVRNSNRSYLYSRFRPRAAPAGPPPLLLAEVAVIPAARVRATWTEVGVVPENLAKPCKLGRSAVICAIRKLSVCAPLR
jgi:hypothetical protein